MSCVLRAGGTHFDVDQFMSGSTWKTTAVWRRGEPRSKSRPDGKKRERSGFNLTVSMADFNQFEQSVEDAERFLRQNKVELLRLIAFPGIERGVQLDFGVGNRDLPAQGYCFPVSLLIIAGECGVDLAISLYLVAPNERPVP